MSILNKTYYTPNATFIGVFPSVLEYLGKEINRMFI